MCNSGIHIHNAKHPIKMCKNFEVCHPVKKKKSKNCLKFCNMLEILIKYNFQLVHYSFGVSENIKTL